MTKQDITRDMKTEIGSFPNISQIAKYLQQSRETTRNLVAGLECIQDGKSKKYYIGDVADRILANRTV